jgi:hypothetical protein
VTEPVIDSPVPNCVVPIDDEGDARLEPVDVPEAPVDRPDVVVPAAAPLDAFPPDVISVAMLPVAVEPAPAVVDPVVPVVAGDPPIIEDGIEEGIEPLLPRFAPDAELPVVDWLPMVLPGGHDCSFDFELALPGWLRSFMLSSS